MTYQLALSDAATRQLDDVARQDGRKHRKVAACLRRLAANPRHPGLRSHKFHGRQGQSGEPIWESYVENDTPGAWRVFWHYGPDQTTIRIITIVAVTPHP